jgi:23S rRNA pseudouridine1911/1915/1917 synthase
MPGPSGIANRTDFTILDESDDYIVVDKPAPLLVHPSKPSPVPTLWDELRNLLAFELSTGSHLSIINRLDRETSGVVLVTKQANAARRFSLAMQARRTEKRYLALVHGWPESDAFTMDGPLLRQGDIQPSAIWLKRMVHPDGQPALTHARVLERREIHGQRFSQMELHPISGRMHQIRVHLSARGFPIVGDKIYRDERCYLDFIDHGWTRRLAQSLLFERHALHASHLQFDFAEGSLAWDAPFPPSLSWNRLEQKLTT